MAFLGLFQAGHPLYPHPHQKPTILLRPKHKIVSDITSEKPKGSEIKKQRSNSNNKNKTY